MTLSAGVTTRTHRAISNTDHKIDEVIALCNDDARGAIKALLLINERLESELHHLYEQLSPPLQPDRRQVQLR
jgi:hypothetical protein